MVCWEAATSLFVGGVARSVVTASLISLSSSSAGSGAPRPGVGVEKATRSRSSALESIGGRCRRGRLGQHQAGRHSRLACADFLGLLAGHFHLLRGECLVLNQLEGSCRSRRGGHCLFGVGSEVIPLNFFTKLGSENPRAKLEPKWPGPLWSSISNTVHVSTCVSTLTKYLCMYVCMHVCM